MANSGNPNHAPAGAPGGIGGQFVSGPQSGGASEDKKEQKIAKSKKTTKSQTKFKKKEPIVTLKSPEALAQMIAHLQDINQGINVPLLSSAEDIDANIEKFFSKQVIGHIDRLFGANEWGTLGYFHPKDNPNMSLNLFTCVMGKYRYKDNHAHLISMEDYVKMSADTAHYTKVYRGFSSLGDKRAKILKSYLTPDINNLDIYGNGCYGTNVYTSTSLDYARDYANHDDARVLYCLVDRNANKITEDQLRRIRSNFSRTYDYTQNIYVTSPLCISIKTKVVNHLIANGIQSDRANLMGNSFIKTLENDESLTAILLGYDYQISSSGQQRNILNLDKWLIAKRW